MWLLRLPLVAAVGNWRERMALVMSFVEVLPLLPVRPVMRPAQTRRHEAASCWRAVRESVARMTGKPSGTETGREATMAAAPALTASAAMVWPSKRSPAAT